MAYQGSWKIDDLLTFYVNTQRFDTGVATDADSAPSYRVYEDETGTPLLTGTMALLDSSNTAGFYSEQITLSAANGFEKGKCYSIYIAATVNSVAGAMHHTFQIEAEVDTQSWNALPTVALPLVPTTAGRTLDVSAGGEAGLDWANIGSPTTTVNLSGTSTLALEPTTAGRKLDVTTGGEAGIDWANIGSPTTPQNLSATNIDTDQVVASVSGAVGSVTGAVGSVGAGGIASTSFAAGAIDAAAIAANAIGASEIAASAITSAKFAAGAIDANALATDAVNEIRDAIFARAYSAAYGGLTFEQITEVIASACAAVCSGLATTTATYRNLNDSADVIVATVDADGNRSAVTLTP